MLPSKPGTVQEWLPGNQDSKRFKLANDVGSEVCIVIVCDSSLLSFLFLIFSLLMPYLGHLLKSLTEAYIASPNSKIVVESKRLNH